MDKSGAIHKTQIAPLKTIKCMKYENTPEGVFSYLVRLTGVEPALLSKIDPKSIVYANFTTGACEFSKKYYIT